jgi:two-component system, OmpR family, response regulator
VKHILLIDDEPLVLRSLELVVSRGGYKVSQAQDGRAGLAVLEREAVDLIITDVFMPEMDGLEVIMACRLRYPAVKVFVLSGGGRAKGIVDGLAVAAEMGADRVFSKPVSASALLEAVEEVLLL